MKRTDSNPTDFPAYRKYKGLNVWFKIENERSFLEIKKLGDRYLVEKVEAEQYPEMLRIQDMLNCLEDRWEIIEEETFQQVEQFI
ncbi:MAG: hypothetical protein MI810_07635 [Flavobacteriales bacterium]|nr:hypothetical protein [Flavobacteriales bacterium]